MHLYQYLLIHSCTWLYLTQPCLGYLAKQVTVKLSIVSNHKLGSCCVGLFLILGNVGPSVWVHNRFFSRYGMMVVVKAWMLPDQ